MINLSQIKLIIWDLDDTFWTGTLSEGPIRIINENAALVKQLVDRGIMNSICSKNAYEDAKNVLQKEDLWDYFIFPRISWQSKGPIIKELIATMKLRSCNVLFIDDNCSNLYEAQHYSPDLLVSSPDAIKDIIKQCNDLPVTDAQHDRLVQYRILEKKEDSRKAVSSNEEFLASSQIQVEIHTDCSKHLDRIHELILRTNQLNYTKERISKRDLCDLIDNPNAKNGYIIVNDKYGEYGICGFFSIVSGQLIHFLFSCRTMGMGVEQYVYAHLGYPDLAVKGEVAYGLKKDDLPAWINSTEQNSKDANSLSALDSTNFHALIKGPCDMEQILAYIKNEDCFTSEFTYVTPDTGVSIESYNHTYHMVQASTLSEQAKKTIIEELPFSSDAFFSNEIYSESNSIVFFSLFTDPNLGLYRRFSGEIVAFGEYCFDLTNPNNWQGYIDGSIFNANCKFTTDILKEFSEKYEYIGRIQPGQVIENLKTIREKMPSTTLLVLFSGVEFEYPNNTQKSCVDRHLYHKELNAILRDWVKAEDNIVLLEFGDIVKTPKEMLNNINHFIKPVYYEMAQRIIELIINRTGNVKLSRRSLFYMWKTYFIQASALFKFYLKIREKIAKLLKK